MKRASVALIAFFFVVVGCAYFNTFYNARKLFREAEAQRLRQQEPGGRGGQMDAAYDKVIKKASKILVFYPKSRWVDDSLLLLGKAFYRKGEYGRAVRKFEELETHFPKSGLLTEGTYWRALALQGSGNMEEAEVVLNELVVEGKGPWSGRAVMALGDLYFEREVYEDAAGYYEQARSRSGEKEIQLQAALQIGRIRLKLAQYDRAIQMFQEVLRQDPPTEMAYEARLNIGLSFKDQGRPDEAYRTYMGMLGRDKFFPHFGEIKLEIGNCYAQMGENDRALEMYERVAEEYAKKEPAAQALYQMGLLVQREDPDRAKKLFDRASKEYPSSQASGAARQRVEVLSQLENCRAALVDTTKGPTPEPLFRMAELFLFQLDRPDSAVVAYRRIVDEFPHSDLVPRALHAIGWILETVQNDTVQAERIFREVMERYPDSERAKGLQTRFGKPYEDPAAEAFLRAEALRLDGGSSTDVLTEYQRIVQQYPESPYAAQSAYVVAWMYENVLRDSLRARAQYDRVIEGFPNSRFRKMVEEKLRLEEKRSRDRAVQDSLKTTAAGVDSLMAKEGPRVVDEADPEDPGAVRKGADLPIGRSVRPAVPDSTQGIPEEAEDEYESD